MAIAMYQGATNFRNREIMQARITSAMIAYQPWEGTPTRPRFLSPVYRVEYETASQRQNILEIPAADAIEARLIASRVLGIAFAMN
jgi:hypothetical protein